MSNANTHLIDLKLQEQKTLLLIETLKEQLKIQQEKHLRILNEIQDAELEFIVREVVFEGQKLKPLT